MNLGDIRTELSAALTAAGWHAYAFVPDDPGRLPAAVVQVPSELEYGITLGLDRVVLPVTLVVSKANPESGQATLDRALSTGSNDSIYDILHAVNSGGAWRSIRIPGAGSFRVVTVGAAEAYACDVTIEVLS